MEIVYFFKDYQVPMYQWQHIHIIDELKVHGCNVTIINPLDFDNTELSNSSVLKYIHSHPVDLFMTPHNEQDLYIETLEKIKREGVPTLLICFDNLVVPFMHFKIAPYFDLVWLTSKETKSLFDKRGCKTIFLPYAANPFLPRTNESIKGVGFVGTPYGSRANMINSLTQNGIPVHCHCLKRETEEEVEDAPLPHSQMSLPKVTVELLKFQEGRKIIAGAMLNKFKKNAILDENKWLYKESIVPVNDLYMVYPRYSLALSSTSARNTDVLKKPLPIVNLRSFEIPMSGGIQICRYSDEMASYFEDGKEIVFYRDTPELIEKAIYYCDDTQSTERKRIRQAAREKAVAYHTWYKRFSNIFSLFGIKA